MAPEPEAVAVSPDLPNGFAAFAAAKLFHGAAEIQQFFTQKVGAAFIPWFNTKIANRDAFKDKSIAGAHLQERFDSFWNGYAQAGPVSLTEFIAYMCIFINERNGELVSKSEGFGFRGHPGIAYLFDSFEIVTSGGRSFHKASYNKAPNKTAGALFKDADFNAAHGAEPMGAQLKNNQDQVWNGQTYPQERFPTSGDPAVDGYILETDFFKFRGRGLIQTTWRANYIELVNTVQTYTGANATILAFRQKWKDISADKVCTISGGADWEALFENSGNEIVSAAIRLHAKAGGYLPLSAQASTLNGVGPGSQAFFGKSIGGGLDYGLTVKSRVRQIALALGF